MLNLNGKWLLELDTTIGRLEMILDLEVNGSELTGTLNGKDNQDVPIVNGKVEGDTISFSAKLKSPMSGYIDTTTTLIANADGIAGKIATPYGTFLAKLTKQD